MEALLNWFLWCSSFAAFIIPFWLWDYFYVFIQPIANYKCGNQAEEVLYLYGFTCCFFSRLFTNYFIGCFKRLWSREMLRNMICHGSWRSLEITATLFIVMITIWLHVDLNACTLSTQLNTERFTIIWWSGELLTTILK